MSRGTNWRTPAVVLFCGGLILMLALGTRQSFGLFLRPMTIDLGCGREVFSFAIALQNLVWGLGMPVAGAIADRYGAGRVLTLGGLDYGLGLLAMAHSTTPLELDATAGLLIGLGLACTGFGVVLSVVARAFPPGQRSFAVGITGACGSIGQFVMLLAGRNAAAQESQQTIGEALAEATAHRGFWLLTASFFVCGFQTIFVMTHLPAYAVDRGLTPTQGMTALATIGFFNIIGSTAAGALGGRYSKKWILFWLYVVRALAIAVYLATPLSAAGTYLFAAVLGVTWLATVPLTNSLVGQIFGMKYLSTLFSLAFLGHQVGAFIGAWAGGAIYDTTGSYQIVWLASIALSVVAAALCVPIDERALVRPAMRAA